MACAPVFYIWIQVTRAMQSVITTHVRKSNQVQDNYRGCLKKAKGRIKRAYEVEQCTNMILKIGEIAG
jgi:hypothetical protein